MERPKKKLCIVFAGGGTGGHIYPGIAVADEIKILSEKYGVEAAVHWIGNARGMDASVVENCLESRGGSIAAFHGIPCGKLRRYVSLQNLTDAFKILAGVVRSFFLLKKLRPDLLFSKGGFVSVPPCAAARLLRIPYVTHECDCTPGLATRLNSSGASRIFISYEETKSCFSRKMQEKCVVTGNPVRPVFYTDCSEKGRAFLGTSLHREKPVLLVVGGSMGSLQINSLIVENLEQLKKSFAVVHQTGSRFAADHPELLEAADEDYRPYAFLHDEMPAVLQACDIVVSRAGANFLWECAVCAKPMILIPLCGQGTRGDQVDNAAYFAERGAALVLHEDGSMKEQLFAALEKMKDSCTRKSFAENCMRICGGKRPSETIASLMLGEISHDVSCH